MKKKVFTGLLALLSLTMLGLNFSVLNNSKTGTAVIDLITVAQADGESGGCWVTGPGYWYSDCWFVQQTNCGLFAYNVCGV